MTDEIPPEVLSASLDDIGEEICFYCEDQSHEDVRITLYSREHLMTRDVPVCKKHFDMIRTENMTFSVGYE